MFLPEGGFSEPATCSNVTLSTDTKPSSLERTERRSDRLASFLSSFALLANLPVVYDSLCVSRIRDLHWHENTACACTETHN